MRGALISFLLCHFVVAVPELLSTVRTKLKELVEVVCIKLWSYKGILSQSVLGSRQASEEEKIRRGGASCLAFGRVALVFALSSLRFFRFCFRFAVLELEFP